MTLAIRIIQFKILTYVPAQSSYHKCYKIKIFNAPTDIMETFMHLLWSEMSNDTNMKNTNKVLHINNTNMI